MSDIIETELGQIIKLGNGKIKPTQEGNIPIYGGNGVLGYCSKSNYTGNVIIIGRVGAYCGSVYYSKNPVWVSDNALAANPKDDNNSKYLYYLLKQLNLNNYAEGSSHPLVTQGLINAIEVKYHKNPEEQQAIAEVLSSLDDKIYLLHRNNKTLEEMAEVIIKDSCKNFDTIFLGEIIEIHDNKRIPLSSIQRAEKKEGILYPYYGAATIMDYVNDYIFDGDFILLGEDGTVQTEDGYPVLQRLQGKAWVNNHAHVITTKAPFNNDLLEIILKNTSISHIVTGAVQPKINQGSLKNLEVIVPKCNIEELCLQVRALLSKRKSNNDHIASLTKVRDTLLPKLMSGQVRVNI